MSTRCKKGTRKDKKTGDCVSVATAKKDDGGGKVLNPDTGRYVKASGKIGKALLAKKAAGPVKAASPVRKPYSFKMTVDCKLSSSSIKEAVYVKTITEWYESFLTGGYEDATFEESRITSGSIQMMHYPDLFKVTYNTTTPISTSEENEWNQWLADPDEDGNHPIKYGNKTYKVSGEVVE